MADETQVNPGAYYNSVGVINALLSTAKGMPEPEEGMGATQAVGSDRYPYTITKVTKNKKGVVTSFEAHRDSYKIIGGSYGSEEYDITPTPVPVDPDLGSGTLYTRRKDGMFRQKGDGMKCVPIRIGDRNVYRDPSF